MRSRTVAGVWVVLVGLVAGAGAASGCGAVADTGPTASDAGPDGAFGPGSDGAPSDATPPLVTDSGRPARPTCDGGATASPNGAACNSSHLLVVRRGAGAACVAAGQFCDTLRLFITEADLSKVPTGFVCEPPDRGYVQCAWPLPASRLVDDAALDGACAATVALPDERVECIIYD